MRRPKRIYTSR
ncbi:hypothetical protein YPPY94_1304, partial [Yersinia pestis PY-94]